jgi:MarR family transcriptional repressor of emrRAB
MRHAYFRGGRIAIYASRMHPRTTANLLGALATALQDSVLGRIEQDTGQSSTAAAALVLLSHDPDCAIDDLRHPLGLSHPGCVRLVDKLEAEGLVSRSPGEDRRQKRLRLTPQGEDQARIVLAARQRQLEEALGALAEEDRAKLGQLVQALLVHLIDSEERAGEICRFCDYASCPEDECAAALALSS